VLQCSIGGGDSSISRSFFFLDDLKTSQQKRFKIWGTDEAPRNFCQPKCTSRRDAQSKAVQCTRRNHHRLRYKDFIT